MRALNSSSSFRFFFGQKPAWMSLPSQGNWKTCYEQEPLTYEPKLKGCRSGGVSARVQKLQKNVNLDEELSDRRLSANCSRGKLKQAYGGVPAGVNRSVGCDVPPCVAVGCCSISFLPRGLVRVDLLLLPIPSNTLLK